MDKKDDKILVDQDTAARNHLVKSLSNTVPIRSLALVILRADGTVDDPVSLLIGQEATLVGHLERQKNRTWMLVDQFINAKRQHEIQRMCRSPDACSHPRCDCLSVKPN